MSIRSSLLALAASLWLCLPAHADGIGQQYPAAGQFPGTTTNDSATAGNVGEYAETVVNITTATNTFTNASPTVVTWTGHPYSINSSGVVAVGAYYVTNSGGAVPTGLVASTTYYAVPIDANTLHIATTVANAVAGTFINTTSTGSGTNTGHAEVVLSTGAAADIGALRLTAGDWDCAGNVGLDPAGGAAVTALQAWLGTTTVTPPSISARGAYFLNTASAGGLGTGQFTAFPLGRQRYSLSSATTVFLSTSAVFSSTAGGFGVASCRRER